MNNQQINNLSEPNANTACTWWPDLRDFWTPVGWKDHAFRFNVLFNGTILSAPWGHWNRAMKKWKDQGAQYTFYWPETIFPTPPVPDNPKEFKEHIRHIRDRGDIKQGWDKTRGPVLWTEFANQGFLIRQEIFAHILGGKKVETGLEPLFAWVRFSIPYICPALPIKKRQGVSIKIDSPHFYGGMSYLENIGFRREESLYPRDLVLEKVGKGAKVIEEKTGLVRLGIIHSEEFCIEEVITEKDKIEQHSWRTLYIEMPVKERAYFDILLPMIPVEKEVYEQEARLGYDNALKETEDFWSNTLKTKTQITTPEHLINNVLKHILYNISVMGEKSPLDGEYCLLTGSYDYSNVWATASAMCSVMCLDTLGYHDMADKYLEVFRKCQGTLPPAGKDCPIHQGYLTGPENRMLIHWINYHGAILWAAAEHALLTMDKDFINRWKEPIIKACEFIRDARDMKVPGAVEGLMPPGIATDIATQIQAVWNDGWCYKGLVTAIKFFYKTGDTIHADEFAKEARDYQETFIKILREKTKLCPAWTADDGKQYHLVPNSMSCDSEDYMHAFYFDAGPLMLVFAGLVDARDELMEGTLRWFREGPQRKLFRYNSTCWQVPVLVHEMASCEPVFSWNIFHSLQLGDRLKYLEGMYSIFAGSVSRQTFTTCEMRGGITGLLPMTYGYLARCAVIEEKDDELHLLRMIPMSWLSDKMETVFAEIPTYFGPVTLKIKTDVKKNGTELHILYTPPSRNPPAATILHIPPIQQLKKVILNGKKVAGGAGTKIVLP